MAWKIELSPHAIKNLDRIDTQIVRRVLRFLHDRLAPLDDPRALGEALKGPQLGNFWKYRVGDYRVIAHIDDVGVRILIVRIGNRRDVYR
jgi:mRNA interferase RelE/StbE